MDQERLSSRRGRHWALAVAFAAMLSPAAWASDHDDGEVQTKGRSRNLTDLYVFKESNQTGLVADAGNLILIMNTNPRSVARQQYFFSSTARYEFHITKVIDKNLRPTGVEDIILRFTFGSPDASGQQAITVTRVNLSSGVVQSEAILGAGVTTPAVPGLGNPNPPPIANTVAIDGFPCTVFAGLREDPFFFDVEQFFRVRAALLGKGPLVAFRDANTAVDFAKGYNVNTIVARVPIVLLQQGNPAVTSFDVWETISVPQ